MNYMDVLFGPADSHEYDDYNDYFDEEDEHRSDDDDDDDGVYDGTEPEPFNSWFERCHRLYEMDPMRNRRMMDCRLKRLPPQRDCLEFQIRDGKSLKELIEEKGRDEVANVILKQGCQYRYVLRRIRGQIQSDDVECVLWLSPNTFFVPRRCFEGIEREGWVTLQLRATVTDHSSRLLQDDITYHLYSLERTCPDDIPNQVLSLIDWVSTDVGWKTISVDSGENAFPFAAAEAGAAGPWALKELVARDPDDPTRPRKIRLEAHFQGLSRHQWGEVMRSYHPQRWLSFEASRPESQTWFPFLLEAIRQNRTPRRLKIEHLQWVESIEELAGAVAECASITDLSVEMFRSDEAVEQLWDAIEANAHLTTLEFRIELACDEWDRLWGIVESHPTLTTVRLSCERFTECDSHDRFPVVEKALQMNSRLTGIETFENMGTHWRPTEYIERIVPLVQWNRFIKATKDVKSCTDPSWRLRLFAQSLCHLTRAETNAVESLSKCLLMLRENTDLLDRGTRPGVSAGAAKTRCTVEMAKEELFLGISPRDQSPKRKRNSLETEEHPR